MAVKGNAVQADVARHIPKFPVAQVLIQPAGVALDLLLVGTVEIAAACYEDVQQAVPVVIDERDAAAERFQDRIMIRLLTVAVGEVQAGFGGHVPEKLRSSGPVAVGGVRRLVRRGWNSATPPNAGNQRDCHDSQGSQPQPTPLSAAPPHRLNLLNRCERFGGYVGASFQLAQMTMGRLETCPHVAQAGTICSHYGSPCSLSHYSYKEIVTSSTDKPFLVPEHGLSCAFAARLEIIVAQSKWGLSHERPCSACARADRWLGALYRLFHRLWRTARAGRRGCCPEGNWKGRCRAHDRQRCGKAFRPGWAS